MSRRLRAAGLAAVVVVLGACAERPPVLFGPESKLAAGDYGVVLRAWTRSDKVYDRLDNIVFVTATYHSPEFRRAFAVAFPEVYGHGGNVTRRELVELTEDVEQYHTFLMVAYTPVPKWNDFQRPDSIWHLSLHANGRTVVPHEITTVQLDENLRRVYPYIGRFDEAYLVRFPLADPSGAAMFHPGTRSFTLRISSALGTGEVIWELGGGSAPSVAPLPPAAGGEAATGEPKNDDAGDATEADSTVLPDRS